MRRMMFSKLPLVAKIVLGIPSVTLQQAAKGTQEVSENIVGVNQTTAETGSAAGQVLATSEELAREAERLRAEVARFIATVRAA